MVALKRTAILVLSAIIQYAVDQLYDLIFRLCISPQYGSEVVCSLITDNINIYIT